METKLGKISKVRFGLGGYQDVCIGIHFTFEFDGCGISDTKSAWDPTMMKRSEFAKWTEEERGKQLEDIMRFVSKLLSEAKVDDVYKLVGTPVEITTENNTMKSWRILTEVM